MITKSQIQRRVEAAQGKIPCDLLIKDVNFLDVFSCSWCHGDIAIVDGIIVGIEPGLKAIRSINGKSKFLVPGFIDAHVHIESSLLIPKYFQKAVLPRGTTAVICDPHEIANVKGIDGIKYFLNEAETMALGLHIMLSSCVPSTHLETNGGGPIEAEALSQLSHHPKALGLAEMMNFQSVLKGDNKILSKLEAFSEFRIDGHCPLVSGQALSAYAASGISSCHESTSLAEAKEKLTKGLAVWIREGSVAKDLKALIPLLSLATSTSIGFCTDDRNPWDISREGHIDYLIRESIRAGVPAPIALRSASWSVARHYNLRQTGAIAPGFVADSVLLDDPDSVAISEVFSKGNIVSELEFPTPKIDSTENSVIATIPELHQLDGPTGKVHVIGVKPRKIITDHLILKHDDRGVAKLTILERHGKSSPPSNGYVHGFGEKLQGAIASSVGHDSHNLIVVGSNTKDMRVALGNLIKNKGGFCVVQQEKVLAELPLPFVGLMTVQEEKDVVTELSRLHQASQAIGCSLAEPFLQLAFLSLPVIPSLKLTDRGLVDVDAFQLIDVRAP